MNQFISIFKNVLKGVRTVDSEKKHPNNKNEEIEENLIKIIWKAKCRVTEMHRVMYTIMPLFFLSYALLYYHNMHSSKIIKVFKV